MCLEATFPGLKNTATGFPCTSGVSDLEMNWTSSFLVDKLAIVLHLLLAPVGFQQ